MRYLLFIAVLCFTLVVRGSDDKVMDIGLLRGYQTTHVLFTAQTSSYSFESGGKIVYELQKGESIRIQKSSKDVRLKKGDVEVGRFPKLKIYSSSLSDEFKLKGLAPAIKYRWFKGGLTVSCEVSRLLIINNVKLLDYIIGVVESESGNYESQEYYKVQAVISRTYALKNEGKFLHEGFMLTDQTNCQVYHGKMYRNENIISAVKETQDLVLVDEDMNYITASYYSNSGGQSVNSEDVWLKKVSYLRSVKDPFSIGKHNFTWKRTISKSKWLSYFERKYDYPVKDSTARSQALNFQQDVRKKYFVDWSHHILLTHVRMDWKLKSTYFSVREEGENVVLEGKGFGHGVGLSQEGAMNMCDVGYDFLSVLRFYYTDIHLIDQNMRNFYLAD